MSYDLECPYCCADLNVNHDDGFGFEEDVAHEMDCHECQKTFTFQTSISYSYAPKKADCLNGSPHNLVVKEYQIHTFTSCKDCNFEERKYSQDYLDSLKAQRDAL